MDGTVVFVLIIMITFLKEEWCRIKVSAVYNCSFVENYYANGKAADNPGTLKECQDQCISFSWCLAFKYFSSNCKLLSAIEPSTYKWLTPIQEKRCEDVCAVGQEYKDYNCSDCDIGFYKDTNGNTNCTKCPINKITLGKGSTSDSNCTITFCGPGFFTSDNITCYKCYKGTYKETTGNNRCTQCPKHKTTLTEGSNSRESCNSTFCDRGTSTTDNITCVDCANGTYKSSPGNQPCTPCPGNKTTFNFGSTDQRNCSITHCDKGFFQSENGLCSVCPNGTYKNFTGNQPCSKCPMNKTTLNVGSTDISNCSLDCATICGKNDPCRDTGTSTCVCKSGYYGPECSKRCSPGCLNTSCSKNNGSCPCKEGYYGAKCLKTGYLDRNNRWSDHYVQKNCSEQICPCSLGWFGQSCQYRDLGVEAIMDNQVLNDNNDSTCGKQNNVTVDWLEEIHAITWIRLVFTSNDNITELEANYFEDHSSEPSFTCGHHSLKIHKTGNTAIDLHCVNSFFIRLLKVSWNSDSPLCSVYVSGERNVALGSRRAKWILNERRAITINTLTDGDYANNGCLKMNSSVTLEITLWNSIYSSEIRLFTDFTKNNGTGFFRIEIFDEYSDTEYKISSSGQDLYVQRAFFMNIFIFNFVKIRVLYGTLHLCEVEIFGDVPSELKIVFFLVQTSRRTTEDGSGQGLNPRPSINPNDSPARKPHDQPAIL